MSTQPVPKIEPATVRRRQRSAVATLTALAGYLLWRQVPSIIIWGLALGALSAMTVAFFPSFSDTVDFDTYLQNLLPEMLALFGLQSSLSTIQGWLAAQVFNMLAPLALAFYPILLGANAIAGAEERGRLDVLLSNPLPRWQLVVGNALAMALGLLGIVAILGLLTWLPAWLLNIDLSVGETTAAVLNLWPLCFFCGGLALLCSSIVRRSMLAVALPAALLVVMYFVNALGGTVEALEVLQPATLFYHYGSAIEHGIQWLSFGIISLLACALVGLAVLAFERRDIYT